VLEHIVDDCEYRPRSPRDAWHLDYLDRRIQLQHSLSFFLSLFIGRCPDCHKIDSILWWNVGDHIDRCIPF
jgi:hypothetical protein